MMRDEVRGFTREVRTWAPVILAAGVLVCLMGWAFAFSEGGVPILVLGSATIAVAMVVRPTAGLLVMGAIALFLAWGGPWWVAGLV